MKHTLHEKTLKNGTKLLLIDVPNSDHFDLAIALNSGSRHATKIDPDQYHVPHLLEHMVFDGSAAYPTQETLHDIFDLSGGGYNGVTTPYHNIFQFDNKVKNGPEILRAALDMVFHPNLKESTFAEEYHVVENELQENVGDITVNADLQNQEAVLPDFPVNIDSQMNRLPRTTYNMVTEYHKQYFGTANTTIILSCSLKKLSAKKIETMILEATSNTPRLSRKDIPEFNFTSKSKRSTEIVTVNKSIKETYASVFYVIPGKPDERILLILGIFTALANSMNSLSVNYKLRKMGLSYSLNLEPSFSYETYGLSLAVQANNDKFFEVFSHTLSLTQNLLISGLPDKVFNKLKSDFIEQLDDAIKTSDDVMGWYYTDYLMQGSLLTPEDHKKIIESITQDKVLSLIRQIFTHKNQFATVLSAKGIRAAAGVDALSKAILVDKSPVDTKLLSDKTISLNVKPVQSLKDTLINLNSYYEYDPNATVSHKIYYFINSRPLLAWTGIVIQILLGVALLYSIFYTDLIESERWRFIGVFVGIAIIMEALLDIYIRHRRYNTIKKKNVKQRS